MIGPKFQIAMCPRLRSDGWRRTTVASFDAVFKEALHFIRVQQEAGLKALFAPS